jgi:hypothetical protein
MGGFSEFISPILERRDDLYAWTELTVFILGRTVESLTYAAVIEHPEYFKDGQLEQEISSLLCPT